MVVQKAEKERAECLSFLLGKLPKGTWQKNARNGSAGSHRGKNTHRDDCYIKRVPRITKPIKAWLIKYCRTDLISIKLKDLDL